jgi:hypothetical protein
VGIKRKQHSAEFKARVAMAALSGEKTLVDGQARRAELVASSHSSDAQAITNPWAGLFCKI